MNFNKIISYVLHPIVMPILGTIIYFIILPKYTSKDLELLVISAVFIGTYIIPLLFLHTLKSYGAIENIHLKNYQERKFPILFFISISFLISTLLKNIPTAIDLSLFFYGMTLAMTITYLILYLKIKVSLHMLGISGLIGFFTFFSFEFKLNLLFLIAVLLIVSGLIATSRLKLNAHTIKEIYLGVIIGVLSEWGVYLIYNYNI